MTDKIERCVEEKGFGFLDGATPREKSSAGMPSLGEGSWFANRNRQAVSLDFAPHLEAGVCGAAHRRAGHADRSQRTPRRIDFDEHARR